MTTEPPAGSAPAPRIRPRVLDPRTVGIEPDPRFTLANERTFLAWIRTSMALVAGGVAVQSFRPAALTGPQSTTVAIFLMASGVVLAWTGLWRWLTVERALRTRSPLPYPRQILVVCVAVTAAGAAIVLFVLT